MKVLFVWMILLCAATTAYPMDEIQLAPSFSPADQRYIYPYRVLKRALEVTEDSDGAFRISYSAKKMLRNRALHELMIARDINVHIAATRLEWEEQTIPVRIPVLKGLLGYRLLLVHKDTLQQFEAIRDVENLKKLRAGAGQQWTTTTVLKESGFNVVTGGNYEGLFKMLNLQRFDYFPRGINEIFIEMASRSEQFPDLRIEPSLALYFPTPSYFFVSPKHPHLADRIRRGLERLIQSGEFDAMFEAQFGDAIAKSKIGSRTILKIRNPLLSDETPFDRAELWYAP